MELGNGLLSLLTIKSYLVVAFDVGDMINGNNKYGNISGPLNI